MSARVSPADAVWLRTERRSAPAHIGTLAIVEDPDGLLSYDALLTLATQRIALVPRFRQKVRNVLGRLASPVWVDDADFELGYHLRRSTLPRPGSLEQLLEFCARIESRLLDRDRPLWELYLVEGLAGDRRAIVTKTHPSLVDGLASVDLAQVLLDESPSAESVRRPLGQARLWMPDPEPSPAELLAAGALELVRRPASALDPMRLAATGVRTEVERGLTGVAGALRVAPWPVAGRGSPALHASRAEHRRIALARTTLADHRRIRDQFGGSVHDAALATVGGALRGWLLGRGESLSNTARLRALVPVGVLASAERDAPPTDAPVYASAPQLSPPARVDGGFGSAAAPARRVAALPIDLPVGEPDPVLRLARISWAMTRQRGGGRAVSVAELLGLRGFAPPTLHAVGTRAGHASGARGVDLVISNAPGPQSRRYLGGARLAEVYPIIPLAAGRALAIGLTSYDGGVFYGITADRDTVGDVAELAGLIESALAELVRAAEAAAGGKPAAGRPRR